MDRVDEVAAGAHGHGLDAVVSVGGAEHPAGTDHDGSHRHCAPGFSAGGAAAKHLRDDDDQQGRR